MNNIGEDLTRDIIIYSLIAGAIVAVPVMAIAYSGVAVARWIWKDKSAV